MNQIELLMIYRMLIVLGGILCIYLGYRLFYVVQERQGDFKLKYNEDLHIQIRDIAPGTYFAVCGTLILAASLMFKTEVITETSSGNTAQNPVQNPAQPTNSIEDNVKQRLLLDHLWKWNIDMPPPPQNATKIHTLGWRECKSIVQTGCSDFEKYQKGFIIQ